MSICCYLWRRMVSVQISFSDDCRKIRPVRRAWARGHRDPCVRQTASTIPTPYCFLLFFFSTITCRILENNNHTQFRRALIQDIQQKYLNNRVTMRLMGSGLQYPLWLTSWDMCTVRATTSHTLYSQCQQQLPCTESATNTVFIISKNF